MTTSRTAAARCRGRLRRRLTPDRGSTTVEMVGYYAVMLFALLVGVQAAAWGLAELACVYSANHALQATRVDGGSAAAGRSDATTILGAVGDYLVTAPSIQTSRGAETATVTVQGTAVKIMPFVTIRVSATASGPVEVLAPEQ